SVGAKRAAICWSFCVSGTAPSWARTNAVSDAASINPIVPPRMMNVMTGLVYRADHRAARGVGDRWGHRGGGGGRKAGRARLPPGPRALSVPPRTPFVTARARSERTPSAPFAGGGSRVRSMHAAAWGRQALLLRLPPPYASAHCRRRSDY